MESVTKYVHAEVGRVEDHQIIAVDGGQMIVKSKSNLVDQAAENPMKVLESFALDDGKRSMQGTFQADKKMRTGGVTMQDRLEDRWKLFERYGLQLEGYCSGNQGKTVMEILLEAKQLFVSTEKVGQYECLRISSRDDWGTTTAWIDNDGTNLLRQWESIKETGNRFANSQVGVHRDTTNFESFSTRISRIAYEKRGELTFAIRGTLVTSQTKLGGAPYTSNATIERTKIELNPDNFTPSLFVPPFAEGARITDYDNFDRDNHFRWRSGQLVPAKNDASGKVTEFPADSTKGPVEVKLGDTVILTLTGEHAKKYAEATGSELGKHGRVHLACIVSGKGNCVELKHLLPKDSPFSVLNATIDELLITESHALIAKEVHPQVADFSVPKPNASVRYAPTTTHRATTNETTRLDWVLRRTDQSEGVAAPKD